MQKPDHVLCSPRSSKGIAQVLVRCPFCPTKELPRARILCCFTTPDLCPYSSTPSSVSCDITACGAMNSPQVMAPLLDSSLKHEGVEMFAPPPSSCWGHPGSVLQGWALPRIPGSLMFSTAFPSPSRGRSHGSLPWQQIGSPIIPRCCRRCYQRRGFCTF